MMPDAAATAPNPRGDARASPTARILPIGDGHELYVETAGDPGGVPAVYLHGGPGSGCQPEHRQLFDPALCRAVLFDQRGCGRSRPKGGRDANTLPHLIADMEAIREALGIARWLVSGGSWGATLALAYAQAHPGRVAGLMLRATFLGSRAEIETAFCETLPRFHPALNDDFLGLLTPDERRRPLDAYWQRILDPDPAIHGPAALAWHDTERILSTHAPQQTRLDRAAPSASRPLPSTPFMEAHYFSHDCFMAPGQLLAGAGRLRGIPGIIVQGRYDLLCPPATAHALAAAWPEAEVRIVASAGHSLSDPGIRDAVTKATADLVALIRSNSA